MSPATAPYLNPKSLPAHGQIVTGSIRCHINLHPSVVCRGEPVYSLGSIRYICVIVGLPVRHKLCPEFLGDEHRVSLWLYSMSPSRIADAGGTSPKAGPSSPCLLHQQSYRCLLTFGGNLRYDCLNERMYLIPRIHYLVAICIASHIECTVRVSSPLLKLCP